MSGMASCFFSLRRSTGVYSVAMWRAVVTVDCTTKMSAPASCGDLGEALGALRDGGDDAGPPPFLISLDPLVDQLFLDRLAVDRLDDLGRLFLAGGDDAIEALVRVVVAGEDALEVEDREAAEPAHLDGELGARRRRPWPRR